MADVNAIREQAEHGFASHAGSVEAVDDLLDHIAELERKQEELRYEKNLADGDFYSLAEKHTRLRAVAHAVVEALRSPGEPDAVIKAIDALAAELEEPQETTS